MCACSWPLLPSGYWPQHVSNLMQSGSVSVSGYGPAEGLPALREALKEKLSLRNNLNKHELMVTAGANQVGGAGCLEARFPGRDGRRLLDGLGQRSQHVSS